MYVITGNVHNFKKKLTHCGFELLLIFIVNYQGDIKN